MAAQASLDLTLWVLLLGGFASTFLFGIFCQQCLTFFRMFTKEGKALQYSVWVLWLFSMANLALNIYTIHWVLITAAVTEMIRLPSTQAGSIMITATGDVIVRSWFLYRIWILSEKRLAVLVLPVILNITILGVGLALCSRLIELNMTLYSHTMNRLFIAETALIVVTDFYIAAAICYFLLRHRGHATRHTRSILNALTVYAVNTGLITSLGWLACLVTHVVLPETLVMNGIYFCLSNLYSVCLLGSLNARDWFRETARHPVTVQLSSFRTGSNPDGRRGSAMGSSVGNGTVEINMHDLPKGVDQGERLQHMEDLLALSQSTVC